MNEYINITELRQNHFFKISTKSEFLKTKEVSIKISYDHLIITKPTIDYRGRIYKVQSMKDRNKNVPNNWRYITVTNDNLIPGKFTIDEDESNEDQLIVYFKE